MTQDDAPDSLAIARAGRGDKAALAKVVRHLARPVHALVGRMLVAHPQLVDDTAQDAFVKILGGLRRFSPDGAASLKTWALTVATRVAIDRLRQLERRGRHLALVDAAPEEVPAPGSLERRAAARQLSERVEQAMGQLDARHRAVLVLRAYHDLDYPEIAEAVGLPIGTVKSRLSRARAALREAMEEGT